ncbi:hypothetical protein BGP_4729 [Beggiatoa sp. PS]|nr:hypothetical protein BGP_4729 [Beggiatoa sp. PS]
MNHGYKMIRIRETPLKELFDNDIVSEKPFNGKKIVDDLLVKITGLFEIDKRTQQRIDSYLKENALQNEKGLEKYVDKLLTVKADKIREG